MSEKEWRANIKDGIGCSLLNEDQLFLLVILGEGSIAKTSGTVKKLSGGDSGFDWKGGRYEGEGLTIDVQVAQYPQAEVSVIAGSERDHFRASWGCGS